VAKNKPELVFTESFRHDGLTVSAWPEDMPNAEAAFAMELLRTNGLLMGDNAGEDSSGRSRMKPMNTEELVKRACDISEQLFAELRERGLMIKLPSHEEARDLARKERERN
jgi:hypothetical protein